MGNWLIVSTPMFRTLVFLAVCFATATSAYADNHLAVTTEMQAEIVAEQSRFFTRLFGGDTDAAMAIVRSNSIIDIGVLDDVATNAAVEIGRFQEIGDEKVTWYGDPPGQPNGLYTAIDYWLQFSAGLACGYTAWQWIDGAPKIIRIEFTGLQNDVITGIPDEEFASLLEQANCTLGISITKS